MRESPQVRFLESMFPSFDGKTVEPQENEFWEKWRIFLRSQVYGVIC